MSKNVLVVTTVPADDQRLREAINHYQQDPPPIAIEEFTELGAGFAIKNPNVKSSCGCGSSHQF